MRTIHRHLAWALVCSAMAGTAGAQTDIRPDEWSRGTTLIGFAGVAGDSEHVGPVLGGAVGWELTRRFAIEGSGSWLDFGHSANAFAGAMKFRTRLFGRGTLDPFVEGGVGLYRAWYGADATGIPRFHARRMGTQPVPGVGATFTDPTLLAGGGVNIFVNRRFALRPELEATFVLRNGRAHTVTSLGVQAVYHFEEHPVTPWRR